MRTLLKKGDVTNPEIQALEARLQAALIPVQPRPEFTQELKRRLLKKEKELEVERPEPLVVQKAVWTAAGLLSGAFLLALGVRGLIALLSSIKSGILAKKAATLNPTL